MRCVTLSVIGRVTDVGQCANAGNPFSMKTLAHLLLLGGLLCSVDLFALCRVQRQRQR